MCLFDRLSGVLTFFPRARPVRTLDNFDLAVISPQHRASDRELTKAVIGAIVIDSYLLPDTKATFPCFAILPETRKKPGSP